MYAGSKLRPAAAGMNWNLAVKTSFSTRENRVDDGEDERSDAAPRG